MIESITSMFEKAVPNYEKATLKQKLFFNTHISTQNSPPIPTFQPKTVLQYPHFNPKQSCNTHISTENSSTITPFVTDERQEKCGELSAYTVYSKVSWFCNCNSAAVSIGYLGPPQAIQGHLEFFFDWFSESQILLKSAKCSNI